MEILYYMDDLKATTEDIQNAETVHNIVKRYASSVGIVVNVKNSAIRLKVETPLQKSLQDIPRMDDTTYKYLGFEMKQGEVERKKMMRTLEERI